MLSGMLTGARRAIADGRLSADVADDVLARTLLRGIGAPPRS